MSCAPRKPTIFNTLPSSLGSNIQLPIPQLTIQEMSGQLQASLNAQSALLQQHSNQDTLIDKKIDQGTLQIK